MPKRTIEFHLAGFIAKMKAAHADQRHTDTTAGYIRKVSSAAGWSNIDDMDAEGLTRYTARLTDEDGFSARTAGAYIGALKSFAKWLVKTDKLLRDPFASIKKPSPANDRRLERRMLLLDEWPWLAKATSNGPVRYGMKPNERFLLYATAIQTGLRSTELHNLTRRQLCLDNDPPFITVKAGEGKSKRDTRQYIKTDLAAELKRHAACLPSSVVFKLPDRKLVATMLREDLAEARRLWLARDGGAGKADGCARIDFLAPKNRNGQTLDFHSLRHTCGAWLTQAGVPLQTVQSIMRHSTIELTLGAYGHLIEGKEADAVTRFPDLPERGAS